MNNKGHPKKEIEAYGVCLLPHHNEELISWEKARRKCIKFFNNKCKWFRRLE
jgi:hypothetical protein